MTPGILRSGVIMWFEIDLCTFAVRQEGFCEQPSGHRTLYLSPDLQSVYSIRDLAEAEYGQAIEVDVNNRVVYFGRDYLGHHPLLYALTDQHLFISDEIVDIRFWLNHLGVRLTTSEEALALYFAAGYIPQEFTLFEQIKSCENASLYRWTRGRVSRVSLFRPVEENPLFPLMELGERIEHQIVNLAET